MEVILNNEKETVKFGSIKLGDAFISNDNLYMRVADIEAANLKTGAISWFDKEQAVIPANVTVEVTKKKSSKNFQKK